MPGCHFIVCLILAPVAIYARQGTTAPTTTCTLDGTAVDFATGEPLRKVTVQLTSVAFGEGQKATTDDSGKFHFENVPEGGYNLAGERTGYIKGEFGARQPGGRGVSLSLKAGERLTDLSLKLARCPIVTGKVVDENGDPISEAMVYPVRRGWLYGRPEYFRLPDASVDDGGNFRIIDLAPGSYYLCASGRMDRFVEKQGGQEKQILWSFYPGSRTIEDARLVNLQAGQEVSGIDFRLRAEPVFHVRGKLVGKALRDPSIDLSLGIYPTGLSDEIVDFVTDMKEDGSFDIPGLPEGNYWLDLREASEHRMIAKTSFEVKKSDVNGLVLSISDPFYVKGVIHLLDTATTPLAQLTVTAQDSESTGSQPHSASVAPDGSFKLQGLWPGKYRFHVVGESNGDYIKSIQYLGRELSGPVDINGAAQVEIVLSGGAGQISGSIHRDDPSFQVAGLRAALIPEAPQANGEDVLVSRADHQGQFWFGHVEPGKYYAFAVDLSDDGPLESKAFATQFQGSAAEIEVPENGDLRIELPLISASDVERAIRSLN